MDSEFPDPDEEFDLVHEDEYELLREIEDLERKKTLQSQKVESPQEKHKQKDELNALIPNTESVTPTPNNNLYKQLNTPIHTINKELNTPTTSHHDEFSIPSTSRGIGFIDNFDVGNTAKRNYDELFGDISDIDDIYGR
ncbi:uncharacterized protein LOC143371336 [Andrena cerasifolii]|uniref:uncharacterized protein LOC143371336 n=1 Tax=Andrena cerasifolii TaxID=2819439 RepID=UPI004037AE4B